MSEENNADSEKYVCKEGFPSFPISSWGGGATESLTQAERNFNFEDHFQLESLESFKSLSCSEQLAACIRSIDFLAYPRDQVSQIVFQLCSDSPENTVSHGLNAGYFCRDHFSGLCPSEVHRSVVCCSIKIERIIIILRSSLNPFRNPDPGWWYGQSPL